MHPECPLGARVYGDPVSRIEYDGTTTSGCLDVMPNVGGACTGIVETHW